VKKGDSFFRVGQLNPHSRSWSAYPGITWVIPTYSLISRGFWHLTRYSWISKPLPSPEQVCPTSRFLWICKVQIRTLVQIGDSRLMG
jgi:hypothetical protein